MLYFPSLFLTIKWEYARNALRLVQNVRHVGSGGKESVCGVGVGERRGNATLTHVELLVKGCLK